MTKTTDTTAAYEALIPLNKLKKSPRNARKTPHSAAAIEATAASIAAKGILQNLVVEPEHDSHGKATGFYLVTIGEGRRLAQLLRVKRKQIGKAEPIRCLVDTANDPEEISLDENVTREAMHPADQFAAFYDLSQRKGWSAEDIAARFGVSAHTVRQRLRLGAVSPRLMEAYRAGDLSLDQLMAFAITPDTERQEQLFDNPAFYRDPGSIRRELTRTNVPASDPRARFVGLAAYEAAGGTLLRDLFSTSEGCYLENVPLLDRLTADKLEEAAASIRAEGWLWTETYLAFPYDLGLRRIPCDTVELTEEEEAAYDEARTALDEAMEEECPDDDRMAELEGRIKALDAKRSRHRPEDIARSGVILALHPGGTLRIDRGLLRQLDSDTDSDETAQDGDDTDTTPSRSLSDALTRDLNARRTLALRATLGDAPQTALTVLTHALAAQTFYAYASASCLDIRPQSTALQGFAKGINDSPDALALRSRHDRWAAELPEDPAKLWHTLAAFDAADTLSLLAHCVSLTVAMTLTADGQRQAHQTSQHLAHALGLDMTQHWTATAENYLARVSKTQVMNAVSEAVSPDAAKRLAGLKKAELVTTAEQLLAGTKWLPAALRPMAQAA